MAARWDQHRRPGRRGFPKRVARRILARDRVCQLGWHGCTETPEIADHIIGWADATAAGWDPADIDSAANGQGVCRACHTRKTAVEAQRGRERAVTAGRVRAVRRPAKPTRPEPPHPGIKPPA